MMLSMATNPVMIHNRIRLFQKPKVGVVRNTNNLQTIHAPSTATEGLPRLVLCDSRKNVAHLTVCAEGEPAHVVMLSTDYAGQNVSGKQRTAVASWLTRHCILPEQSFNKQQVFLADMRLD
jgi:hypothetical protein